jgi:hypothetical protein
LKLDAPVIHDHVKVGGSHINPPALNVLTIGGVPGRQWSCPGQNLGKATGRGWRNVQDNEQGSRKGGRQAANECGESLDAACRSSNHDDLAPGAVATRARAVKLPKLADVSGYLRISASWRSF